MGSEMCIRDSYLTVQDDLPALVARAEEIRRDGLHRMGLVTSPRPAP